MGAARGFDEAGKLEDLDVGGAVVPVVVPADDYVAAGQRMAVVAEIAALKFKFDVHALPALGPLRQATSRGCASQCCTTAC